MFIYSLREWSSVYLRQRPLVKTTTAVVARRGSCRRGLSLLKTLPFSHYIPQVVTTMSRRDWSQRCRQTASRSVTNWDMTGNPIGHSLPHRFRWHISAFEQVLFSYRLWSWGFLPYACHSTTFFVSKLWSVLAPNKNDSSFDEYLWQEGPKIKRRALPHAAIKLEHIIITKFLNWLLAIKARVKKPFWNIIIWANLKSN